MILPHLPPSFLPKPKPKTTPPTLPKLYFTRQASSLLAISNVQAAVEGVKPILLDPAEQNEMETFLRQGAVKCDRWSKSSFEGGVGESGVVHGGKSSSHR